MFKVTTEYMHYQLRSLRMTLSDHNVAQMQRKTTLICGVSAVQGAARPSLPHLLPAADSTTHNQVGAA